MTQDTTQAVTWLRKAAAQDLPAAESDMGKLCFAGMGVRQNLTEGATWFRKAADHEDIIAQYQFGLMASRGHGVNKDLALAAKYWERSANQGHPWAAYQLGLLYADGSDVPKNAGEALKWLAIAGQLGSKEPDLLLQVMAARERVSKDVPEADCDSEQGRRGIHPAERRQPSQPGPRIV